MSEQSEYAIRDALTKIWGQSAGHWMGTNSFPFDYCMAEYVFYDRKDIRDMCSLHINCGSDPKPFFIDLDIIDMSDDPDNPEIHLAAHSKSLMFERSSNKAKQLEEVYNKTMSMFYNDIKYLFIYDNLRGCPEVGCRLYTKHYSCDNLVPLIKSFLGDAYKLFSFMLKYI